MAKDRQPMDPARVEKAAARLRAIEREVLYLSAAEKLYNDEVAERLGMTTKQVERLLARALCKFDRALHEEERPWWKFW